MPYLVTETTTDEHGVKHPVGTRERVDLITNPLAIINRTIPMVMFEGSVTFILDKTRKHAATLSTREEKKDFIFDVIRLLNPIQANQLEKVYAGLSEFNKTKFIEDCISINKDGTLNTKNGIYIRWEPFDIENGSLRDNIIKVYEKYEDIMQPYHIFVPKRKWGRDIYIGDDCVGYQMIMMLKQSGEKGFSVRSAGAISDEGLPDKSNSNRNGTSWKSEKPIKILLV